MATGDAAAAAGMDLVAGSSAANTLDTEDNKTRDYIAPIKVALDAASSSSSAAAYTLVKRDVDGKFGVPTPTADTHPANKEYVDDVGTTSSDPLTIMRRNSAGQTAVATPTTSGQAANKGYVDSGLSQKAENDTVGEILAGYLNSEVYSRTLGGSYRNLYISNGGTLGWVSSSERFKENVADWTPDRQAILAMQLVQFQYKAEIDPDGVLEHGLIAEQLHELGLEWLVDYDAAGEPEGVRYDRISLALLSVVQDHDARLTALEQGA